jgi:hypothetical protein
VDGPRVVRVTVEPQSRPTALPKDGTKDGGGRPSEPPAPSGETG